MQFQWTLSNPGLQKNPGQTQWLDQKTRLKDMNVGKVLGGRRRVLTGFRNGKKGSEWEWSECIIFMHEVKEHISIIITKKIFKQSIPWVSLWTSRVLVLMPEVCLNLSFLRLWQHKTISFYSAAHKYSISWYSKQVQHVTDTRPYFANLIQSPETETGSRYYFKHSREF